MTTEETWAEGNVAPYALYATDDGEPCEAIGDARAARVNAGDVIDAETARWVLAHCVPGDGEPVEMDVLQRDKDGVVLVDKGGNPVVEPQIVNVVPDFVQLTEVHPAPDDPPQVCDQCGNEREELFPLGSGRYCKIERTPAGGEPDTCYNIRLAQLAAQ